MIKLVILGSGNVATHLFQAFFKARNVAVVQVYNRTQKNLAPFAQKTQTTTSIKNLIEADVYLLCVKDDAIGDLARNIPYKDKIIAHTSGSVPLLDNSQKTGVFYPLQTFSKDVALDFKKIPLCLEASDEQTLKTLQHLAGAISEKSYQISTAQRKSLHLAAVFVCNFTNHLYSIGEGICRDNQVPFDILHPLMKETTRKATLNSPAKMQTGPAKRNDRETMQMHLSQLKNPVLEEIYVLLSKSIASKG